MKFDVVITNPPYQDHTNKHSPLWQKFVSKAFELIEPNGFLCAIHPSAWRKPNHSLWNLTDKGIRYLEIHDQSDGMKTFGAGTRYDWHITQNREAKSKTVIVDENGKRNAVNLQNMNFLPNVHSEFIIKCLADKNQTRCNIIHSRTMYGNDKPWMSKEKNATHKFPCIYSTPCGKQPSFLWSSKKEGHFGISKVVVGKASPENAILDFQGKYGITNNCFGILIDSPEEGEMIVKALKTKKMKDVIGCLKWAGFSFEYRVMLDFRKDFWKEFVDEDGD